MASNITRGVIGFCVVSIPCFLLAVDPPSNGVTPVQYSRAAKGKASLGTKRAARGTAELPDAEDYDGTPDESAATPPAKKGLLKGGKPAKKKESTDSHAWDELLKSRETEKEAGSESEESEGDEAKATPAETPTETATPKRNPLNPSGVIPKARGRLRGVMPRGATLLNAVSLTGGESLAPQISVAWKHQGNFVLGKQTTCLLVVKNQGKQPVQHVALDVSLASGAKLISTRPQAEETPSCLTWQLDSIGAEEERTFEVSFIPQERGDFPATAALRVTSTGQAQFYVEEPLLKLAIHAPKTSILGEMMTPEVTVTNPGTGTAHNVVLESDLPQGLSCPNGAKLSQLVGEIKPGEAKTVRLELKAAAKGPQTFTLAAKGEGDVRDASDVALEVLAPSLKLEASGPSLRYVNRRARYQFSITNTGNSPARDVQIVGMIPAGFQVLEAGQAGKIDPETKTVSWTFPRLAEGESATMSLDAMASEVGMQSYLLKASAAHGAEAVTTCETRVDGVSSVSLEIRDQDDPVETRVDTGYELRIRNDGSKTARDLKVTCELPAEMQFLSGTGPTEVLFREGVITLAPLAALEPGKEAVYKLNVRSLKTGNAKLRAKLVTPSLQKPVTAEELTRIYAD